VSWRGACTITGMKRVCLLIALAAASTASANDAMLRIERQIGAGFTIRAPHVAQTGDVVNVSGTVCRRAFAAAQPRAVEVEFVDPSGAVVDTQTANIRGVYGYRGGCGFYDVAGANPGVGGAISINLARELGE